MWELDYKESWAPKNWCFWNVVLEKTLESPLDCREIKPVNPKGNQPCIFIGWTNTEAPILWLPDAKSWLVEKDPDAGKDWSQEEKGATEDEMIGWHHWLNGHELEQTPGDGEGQGSLACCSPWGHKESDTTEQQQQKEALARDRRVGSGCFSVRPLPNSSSDWTWGAPYLSSPPGFSSLKLRLASSHCC